MKKLMALILLLGAAQASADWDMFVTDVNSSSKCKNYAEYVSDTEWPGLTVTYCHEGMYTVKKVTLYIYDSSGDIVWSRTRQEDLTNWDVAVFQLHETFLRVLLKDGSSPNEGKLKIKYWIIAGSSKNCTQEFDLRNETQFSAYSEGETRTNNRCKGNTVEYGDY